LDLKGGFNIKKGRKRKWYEGLKEQRARDVETEMI
jgi:hypothetical protein